MVIKMTSAVASKSERATRNWWFICKGKNRLFSGSLPMATKGWRQRAAAADDGDDGKSFSWASLARKNEPESRG